MAGPTMRAALNAALLSATAEPTSGATDHLDHERLADGHVEGIDDAQQERHDHDLPHLHMTQQHEHAQHQREHIRPRTGCTSRRTPLGQRVRGEAAEQAQDHHRHELGSGHEAQRYGALVSWSTSQSCATACIQVPVSDTSCPK